MKLRKKSFNFLFQPVYLSSTPCGVIMTPNMLYSFDFILKNAPIIGISVPLRTIFTSLNKPFQSWFNLSSVLTRILMHNFPHLCFSVDFLVSQTHFHFKGCARGLVLKKRLKAIRKWFITLCGDCDSRYFF